MKYREKWCGRWNQFVECSIGESKVPAVSPRQIARIFLNIPISLIKKKKNLSHHAIASISAV